MGLRQMWETTKDTLRKTSLEVALGAAMLGSLGLYVGHNHEAERAKYYDISFSEYRQIEKDLINESNIEKREIKPEERASNELIKKYPFTFYLPVLNDTTMKIFEAWDNCHGFSISNRYNTSGFAKNLEEKLYRDERHRYSLEDLLKILQERAGFALGELNEIGFIDIMNRTNSVANEFNDSWSHRRDDYGHWETETDDDGNVSSEYVYDYSIQHYTYHKDHGESASKLADELVFKYPDPKFRENVRTTTETHEDGEEIAKRSRKMTSGKETMTKDELMESANLWKTGSTLMTNLPELYSTWVTVTDKASRWRDAKAKAKSQSYRTEIQYDAGPIEYQIAREALTANSDISRYLSEVVSAINYVSNNSDSLRSKIQEAINMDSGETKGDLDKTSKDVINITRDMYRSNFKGGLDVDRYRMWMVALFTLLGIGIGSGIGYGLDVLGDKYQLWGQELRSRRF